MKKWKVFKKVLAAPENIRFGDMVALAEAFGFVRQSVSGSHPIFSHPEMTEMLNLQEWKGKAKAYQIRQFLKLIEKYGLDRENDS